MFVDIFFLDNEAGANATRIGRAVVAVADATEVVDTPEARSIAHIR